jgi:hypothetical protein
MQPLLLASETQPGIQLIFVIPVKTATPGRSPRRMLGMPGNPEFSMETNIGKCLCGSLVANVKIKDLTRIPCRSSVGVPNIPIMP